MASDEPAMAKLNPMFATRSPLAPDIPTDDFPTNKELEASASSQNAILGEGTYTTAESGQLVRFEPTPHGTYVTVRVPEIKTAHVQEILGGGILEETLRLFIEKSNQYGEPDGDDLGLRGQYADMHRKWKLLKKEMWDGGVIEGDEDLEERLMDLIGHCLKAISFKRSGR